MGMATLARRGIAVCLMVLMLALAAGCGDSSNEYDAFIAEYEKVVTTLESKAPDQLDPKELQDALLKMSETAIKLNNAKVQPTAEQAKKIQDLTARLQKLQQQYAGQ